MQEIANAGLCKIFVDRENRIVIKCEDEEPQKSPIAVVPGNMFSYKSNITLTDFSNSVSVDYCEISIKDDVIDVAEPEIRLEPNETKLMTIDYTSEVAYPTAASNNAAVRIVSFNSGVNSCTCELRNTTGTVQTAVITVSGNAIDINTRTVTVRDEESIYMYGIVEYKHPTSELVQSYEQAEYMANLLLDRMRAGAGTITAVWRGNPELEVGAAYDCTDRFGDKESLLCEYNKFTYDGGLKQETRGRKKGR